MTLREAQFYTLEKDAITCRLCAQQCTIRRGGRGKCGVRQNIDDTLYSLVYGKMVAEHVDPIEKKPLFHVLPGSTSLSISAMGCNFHCHYCQNSSISQVARLLPDELSGRKTNPAAIVQKAKAYGCETISYTYVEPTVFYEFAYDCAVMATANSVKNVFVSNGYISAEATRKIAPYLAGINIDLKFFTDQLYKEYCGARLQPVLDCIKLMKELGVWVEVTTLVIFGLNDAEECLRQTAEFLCAIDPAMPWHVTAFHPAYHMRDRPRTSAKTLSRARQIGRDAGLHYVYAGNVPGSGGQSSFCHHCDGLIIERHRFSVRQNRLINGRCPDCATPVAGIWQ